MIRTLTLIAAVSFVLVIGCFAGVLVVAGGPFWIDDTGNVHGARWGEWGLHHATIGGDDHQSSTQRAFTWSGGHKLAIDLPADVTYTQGATTQLTITGPADILNRITIQDGEIRAEGVDFDDSTVKIALTAPDVDHFEVNGSGDLTINGFNHDQLGVDVAGSGKVVAHGQAKRMRMNISGSGDADLSDLKLDEAKLSVEGSGDATLAPKQLAEVDIAGSGNVHLLTTPKSEQFNITGSGQVNQPHS